MSADWTNLKYKLKGASSCQSKCALSLSLSSNPSDTISIPRREVAKPSLLTNTCDFFLEEISCHQQSKLLQSWQVT